MSTRTSISMPDELNKELISLAESENRSISSMIQVCIKESLESRGIKKEPTAPKLKFQKSTGKSTGKKVKRTLSTSN